MEIFEISEKQITSKYLMLKKGAQIFCEVEFSRANQIFYFTLKVKYVNKKDKKRITRLPLGSYSIYELKRALNVSQPLVLMLEADADVFNTDLMTLEKFERIMVKSINLNFGDAGSRVFIELAIGNLEFSDSRDKKKIGWLRNKKKARKQVVKVIEEFKNEEDVDGSFPDDVNEDLIDGDLSPEEVDKYSSW